MAAVRGFSSFPEGLLPVVDGGGRRRPEQEGCLDPPEAAAGGGATDDQSAVTMLQQLRFSSLSQPQLEQLLDLVAELLQERQQPRPLPEDEDEKMASKEG